MTTTARPDARFYDATDQSAAAFQALLDEIPAGARVLELGCGRSCQAHHLAARGCVVTGISADPRHVEAARLTAADEGLTTATFGVMSVENLDFDDASFDAIVASGVLHRSDIAVVLSEVARVITPAGRVVLLEPLGHNPVINAYRRRTPGDRHRFEHPIRRDEISLAQRWFTTVDVQTHHLLSIATARLGSRGPGRVVRGVLGRVDRVLLSKGSPLRWQGWIAVITLEGPR